MNPRKLSAEQEGITTSGTEATAPRILVTLDGSARDTLAVAEAAKLAAGLAAQIILLRVIRPPRRGHPETPNDVLPLVDLAERETDAELRAHQAAFPGLPVTRIVLIGTHPAREITGWLRQHPVDFVVMAPQRKNALRRLFSDGVSEAVRQSGLASVIAVSGTGLERYSRSNTLAGDAGRVGAAAA